MTTDTLDELAALGHAGESSDSTRALTDMVERNPVPAVLAAAAAGAGLMALVALMTRREPNPLAPVPLVAPRALDSISYDALKQQIADLADRVSRAVPIDAAKEQVSQAGDALADGWSSVREQALDVLNRFEPQAGAALKVARENPVWTALVVGAVGALVGSQLLGKSAETPAAAQSDPGADA